jgi:hypothetical protein
MKTPNHLCEFPARFLRNALLVIILWLTAVPELHAGLTLTIDFYRNSQGQNYVFYTPVATNNLAPAAALGTYVISSPDGQANGAQRGFDLTAAGISDRPEFDFQGSYNNFNSALQQITNGTWSILFTNATTTNLYTFTVSAPTINSNLMPATIIISPENGAINVPNQPTFTLQNPIDWPVMTANTYFYNYDFSFFDFPASIPASQTTWTDADPLPNGLNCTYNLDYVTNYTGALFVATTPVSTNVSYQAISGWATASILETGDSVSFAVTNPAAVGTTLIAHYPFDNSGNLGHDTSGNGYDLNFNGADGVTFSSTAAAGSGAAYFDGFSFLSYTTMPSNILSTLAGDFSLSFWIKTTETDGNGGGEAYAGAGIVAADVPGSHYDLVPAALDGGEIGFNTGPDDDTLNSTVNLNDGNYHHVVITRHQATGEKQIYVDGHLNTTDFATMNPLSDPHLLAVGCQIDASQSNPGSASISSFYEGLLDDLQIYSGVLSSNQVAQLYANPGTTAVFQDFNVALDTTNLNWTTSGDSSWFVETTNTSGSPFAVQSGSVTGNQSSTLSVTVTGPGTLTFYWSSIANDANNGFDCEFALDGGDVDDLYGDTSWYLDGTPFIIPAGQHTLSWTAYADGDTDPTEVAFLDEVNYVPDTTPVITLNPFSQTNYPGYQVWLAAGVATNLDVSWQWYEVGSGPISGATNYYFIPTNSGTAGVAGDYYAIASNSTSSAITTTAAVYFVSAPLPPAWSRAVKSPFSSAYDNDVIMDYFSGCAVDSAGEVYVADEYVGIVNVESNFVVLNTLTAVGTNGAAALVKYDSNGNPIWAVGLTNNQPSSYSYGVSVALAPGNGAYLASTLIGTNWLGTNQFVNNGGDSVLLSRFDANGSNVWSRLIGQTNQVFCSYNSLVSDASGNVTVGGILTGTADFGGTNLTAQGFGGFLAQYNSNGTLLWAQVLSGIPWNLAYGGGKIYVALSSVVSGGVTNLSFGSLSNLTDRAYGLVAVNATNGQPIWLRGVGEQYGAKTYGAGSDDIPLVSVSGSEVMLTGTAYGSTAVFGGLSVALSGGRSQYFARYDTNGNPQVATGFGSSTTTLWAATANNSGVYVSGDFDDYSQFGNYLVAAPEYAPSYLGAGYFTQPFVAKFDLNGNPLWARNGVSSTLGNFRGIATSSTGVWASGIVLVSDIFHPAQFGTNTVFSDDYIYNFGTGIIALFTQGGLLTQITETTTATPVTLLSPQGAGTNFQFQFLSEQGFSYNILYNTNLAVGTWLTNSTVSGDGTVKTISLPYSIFSPARQGFIRVTTQ